jgi:hypothetical protein
MFLQRNIGIFALLPTLYYKQITVIPVLTFTYQETDPFASSVILNINDDVSLSGNNKTFKNTEVSDLSSNPPSQPSGTPETTGTTQSRFSPFSPIGWCAAFNNWGIVGGTRHARILHNSALNLGTENFTIECWSLINSTLSTFDIFYTNSNNSNGVNIRIIRSTVFAYVYNSSNNLAVTLSSLSATNPLITNTWNHIALVRNNTIVSLYLNGVLQLSSTGLGNDSVQTGTQHFIGSSPTTTNLYNGLLSNLRVVKGSALYTSNFTPPSGAPLEAIPNTVLLTLQNRDLKDNSVNNLTLSSSDTFRMVPQHSPASTVIPYDKNIHGGSVYFNSNNSARGKLRVPCNKNVNPFGNKQYTIELWFYIDYNTYPPLDNTLSRTGFLILQLNSAQTERTWNISVNGTTSDGTGEKLSLVQGSNTVLEANTSPHTRMKQKWHHLAITNNNTNFTMYLNGSAVATKTFLTSPNSSDFLEMGAAPIARREQAFNGYISNLRIVNGQCVYTNNFTPPSAPVTEVSNGGAMYGSTYVPDLSVKPTLLLNFDNAGIVDETYKHAIMDIGGLETTSLDLHNNYKSLSSDGSTTRGGFMTNINQLIPQLAPWRGPFTIEFWVRIISTTGSGFVLDTRRYDVINVYNTFTSYGGGNHYYIKQSNTNMDLTIGTTNYSVSGLQANTWHHIAYVRTSSNIILTFKDGVSSRYINSNSTNIINSGIIHIASNVNGSSKFNGSFKNLRITTGIARYTTNNFTPPTDFSLQNDPHYSNVDFLLGTNENSPSNRIFRPALNQADINTLNSGFINLSRSISAFGTPTQNSNFSPFLSSNIGSGYFDGSSYLQLEHHSNLLLNNDDFTVECWVNLTKLGVDNPIFCLNASTNDGLLCLITNENRVKIFGLVTESYWHTVQVEVNSISTLSINTWNHIAVVRYGTSFQLYLNGVLQATETSFDTNSINNGTEHYIGTGVYLTNGSFNGYISNFRINKGAVYKTNFTPSTTPLSGINGTVLVLNFDNDNIIDTANNNIITSIGNTRTDLLSTASLSLSSVSAASKGSLFFDGTDSYLKLPITVNQQLSSGNFTIEFWINRLQSNQNQSVLDYRIDSASQARPHIYINSSNQMVFNVFNTDQITSSLGSLSTWNHIAIVKDSSITKMFVNGVSASTIYTDTNTYLNPSSGIHIGTSVSLNSAFRGYLDDIRITKDARYTENFTTVYKKF